MSILMEALKQQVEPTAVAAGSAPANGWRNLALLLGFCLALLLGFALASWWQTTKAPPATVDTMASQQAEPEVAGSSTIVAALLSTAPEIEPSSPAQSAADEPAEPKQEQFKAEPKVVSVTAPTAESAAQSAETQAEVASQPEVAVSDELRQRFASAMAASEVANRQPGSVRRGNSAPAPDVSELAPALQRQIPPLRFEAHVYATQGGQRWIKVNGKSLQEGQWVTADIQLHEITPHFVLLKMGNDLFSMPALTDYN